MLATLCKKIVLTVAFCFITAFCFGGEVNLTAEWEQEDTENRIDRWVLYQSTTSGGEYTEIGTLTREEVIEGLTKDFILESPDGEAVTYYFVVKAFDDDFDLESEFSNEVAYEVDFTVLPAPMNFTITIRIVTP